MSSVEETAARRGHIRHLYRDTDISRQLASDGHAELKQDWQCVNPAAPDMVESQRRQWRFRFDWLRTRIRPARHVPSGHTP